MSEYADHPDLAPEEKEVTMRAGRGSDTWRAHSDIGTVTKYLCEHPEVEVLEKDERDGTIVSAKAELPLTLIGFKVESPNSTQWNRVITSVDYTKND